MFRSALAPIFLTVFVDVLGLTLVIPLMPFYAEHFGASAFVATWLPPTFAICQLVSGPILGRLSDRMGRKPVLLVSQLGTCAGFIMMGAANSLWMLFAGRIIDGLTAGNLTIAQAYISDVTKPEDRIRAFAVIGIAFGVGFLIGPAISGVIAHRFGYGAPLYGAAGLSALSVLTTATLIPRVTAQQQIATDNTSRSAFFKDLFTRPAPRFRLLEFFAYMLSFSTMVAGLPLFLERRFHFNVEQTGWVYAFSGLIGLFVHGGLLRRHGAKIGEHKLAQVGFIAMVVGYSLLGIAFDVPVLLAVTVVSAFGAAVTRPSLTTLLTRSVGPDEQGAALGVSQSLSSIATILGPPAAGFLIDHDILWAHGVAAGAFALIGALLVASDPARIDAWKKPSS